MLIIILLTFNILLGRDDLPLAAIVEHPEAQKQSRQNKTIQRQWGKKAS